VTASDQRTQLAEDNQELLGQGPSVVGFSQRAPAVMGDARHELNWGEISLLFSEVEVRAAASVPIGLADGPIGTLDVYAAEPRDWDQSEVSALQAYAAVVASLLAAAAQAQVKGRLAAHSRWPLRPGCRSSRPRARSWSTQDSDEATAFEWLRLSAGSSSKIMTAVAEEILAGRWPPIPQLAEAVGGGWPGPDG